MHCPTTTLAVLLALALTAAAPARAQDERTIKFGHLNNPDHPFAVILSNKFHEVQKYVSATNHVYAANIILVSKRFWDKLSPAEQKMMVDAANETRAYQRETSRTAARNAVGELQAKGMAFNEVAPAEQQKMAQTARSVTDKFAASYDPTVVKLYNNELARTRK